MADGDPWKTNRTACDYISDKGTIYRFRALERYVAQPACGWVACTQDDVDYAPRGLKPRRWLMFDAGDHSKRRAVVIATNAAYVAGVVGTTTLAVQNPTTDVEDTFTLYEMEGERRRGKQSD